jgi:predicted SAM-dependent methyltransferase
MDILPYLNLGCGTQFSPQWTNVDFSKTGDGVVVHNLLEGIPFGDNTFEVVYHSHVLEHFTKDDAIKYIAECYRVLKPNGIIRIAVPDLEQIVNNYNRLLTSGKADPDNKRIRADYDWIMTEMYDQAVRNRNGGEMLKYLSAKTLENEDFVLQRIGHVGYMIRQSSIQPKNEHRIRTPLLKKLFGKIKGMTSLKKYKDLFLKSLFSQEYKLIQLGRFRQSGEIHQWMYDIYSLRNLLKDAGFKNIEQKDFDKSQIPDWRSFSLDEVNNTIRKPDSLFVEATK